MFEYVMLKLRKSGVSCVRLQKKYWVGRTDDEMKLSNEDFMTLVPENRKPYFETWAQNAKAGIQIRGLTKVGLPVAYMYMSRKINIL